MDFGMRKLMELFYRAVREGGPDPIPAAEILRTARIMDAIFHQMPAAARRPSQQLLLESPTAPPTSTRQHSRYDGLPHHQ